MCPLLILLKITFLGFSWLLTTWRIVLTSNHLCSIDYIVKTWIQLIINVSNKFSHIFHVDCIAFSNLRKVLSWRNDNFYRCGTCHFCHYFCNQLVYSFIFGGELCQQGGGRCQCWILFREALQRSHFSRHGSSRHSKTHEPWSCVYPGCTVGVKP